MLDARAARESPQNVTALGHRRCVSFAIAYSRSAVGFSLLALQNNLRDYLSSIVLVWLDRIPPFTKRPLKITLFKLWLGYSNFISAWTAHPKSKTSANSAFSEAHDDSGCATLDENSHIPDANRCQEAFPGRRRALLMLQPSPQRDLVPLRMALRGTECNAK